MSEFRPQRRFPGFARLMAVPALALGLAVSGCADQAETEALIQTRLVAYSQDQLRAQVSELQNILAALRQTTACVTAVEAKPLYRSLQLHTPKDGPAPPSPSVLTDARKASAIEAKLITAFLVDMEPCRPSYGPLSVPANRNIAKVIDDTWHDQRDLYEQLKNQKIGWGRFNLETRSNSDKLSGALKALRLTNEG